MRKITIKGYKRICNDTWKDIVRAKFKYKCGIPECQTPKACINAHHIFSKKGHPSTRYDIDNGFLLCFNHHSLAHRADPDTILKLLSKLDTSEYEKLRQRAKSGSCKHDYPKVKEELEDLLEYWENALRGLK